MKSVLVTGGAGFIGSHIVEGALEKGYSVKVLDNLSSGKLENLAAFKADIEFIEGDIGDADVVAKTVAGVDLVIHQAAMVSVPLSLEKPLEVNQACVTGTLNLLNESQRAGVQRFVYAASSACYGDMPYSAKRESDPMLPMSPYAAAKLGGELYCQAYFHSFGLETVGLRYFNVFGPRQDPDSPYSAVIPLFIMWMLRNQSPTVYGDGLQSRDFTFVKNVVAGNLLAAEKPGIGGKVFNMADGRSTDLLTLIRLLNQFLGTDVSASHQPKRAGDIRDSLADISAAQKELGYEPQVTFEEGLQRSIDYYRELVESGV